MSLSPSGFSRIESLRVAAPPLILAVGVIGFFTLKQHKQVAQHPPERKQAPLVDVVPVEAYTDALTITADGQVVPYREVTLSAEVAGRIVKKTEACDAGKFVSRGDLLLQIDPTDYELQKNQLMEEEEQAQAALDELEVDIQNTRSLIELAQRQLELKKSELERQKELLLRKATSQSEVEGAEQAVLQADNALRTLQNELTLSNTKNRRLTSALDLVKVRLEEAQRDLDRTRITAPLDGVVVRDSVEEGAYVQKGSPLVTLEDTSAVEVKCQLQMDELYWIWDQAGIGVAEGKRAAREDYQLPETPATVVYRLAGREYLWDGVLWRYDGIGLDERTRTVPCRVLVKAPEGVRLRAEGDASRAATGPPALVRGMFVALEIRVRPQTPLLRLPEAAIQPDGRVWRVRESRLFTIAVRVVEIRGEAAVVSAAPDELRPGDRVVTSPLADVVEGMAVREQRPEAASVAAAQENAPAAKDPLP